MRKKKATSPKRYKGVMKFPLVGADSKAQFDRSCEFGGDFIDPVKRYKIFKRPRAFRVEIWLKVQGQNEWDVTELTTQGTLLGKHELSQLMHQYAVSECETLGEVEVNSSYFKVIL